MTEETEQKPGEYLIGLALGTAVAGAAWFLYQTKKGRKLRRWWEKYFEELRSEWKKLAAEAPAPVKPAGRPRHRARKPKKKTFFRSGQSL